MNKEPGKPEKPAKPEPLRAAAGKTLVHAPKPDQISAEELLHELQVYQIELEMQNEQLRQAQVALEESRDNYLSLYEFAPVSYFTLTAAGQIKEANLTCSRLLKMERKKLLHRRFSTFVVPEHHDRWNCLFMGMLQQNGVDSCELAIKNGDGERLYVRLNCVCLITEGAAHVVRIMLTDMTYLRQAEEAMREWQTFVECATWGMTIGEIESRTIRLANPAYARMHGYKAEELRNVKADLLYAPESRASLPHYAECVLKDRHITFECVRLRKDGSTFPAVVDISIVDGVDGKIVTMVSVRDITERKQAELQLMESEQQFRTLAESGQALIWASGTDKLCNYFNKVWLDFTGRSMEQELGNGWAEGVYPEDLQRCLEVYASAFDRREKFSMDYRLRHHDGSYHWIQDDGCPRYNSRGEFIGYIGFCLHITGRKRMERQLHDLAAHMLTVREEEKAVIAREIHDDLGGTLTALKMEAYWLAEELSEHNKSSSLLGHVKLMAQLTDNATNVTRRIITGLRPTILDDLGLLAALEWQCTQFQKHTGIRCRVNYVCTDGENCEKELDKHRSIALFRIAQEALTNVSRHSFATKVDVEFYRDDSEVMLLVSDNGRGMPENRTHASSTYGMHGMTERAEQLGGEIKFNNSPNGGFSVTVILPLSADNTKKEKT